MEDAPPHRKETEKSLGARFSFFRSLRSSRFPLVSLSIFLSFFFCCVCVVVVLVTIVPKSQLGLTCGQHELLVLMNSVRSKEGFVKR